MEPCMSTSTCDRSANIWPNILKLHMHEYVGAAVGGTLLEGRREATPLLCPGLGPAWPKCDRLLWPAHHGNGLTWRDTMHTYPTSGFRGGGRAGGARPPFEIPKRVFKRACMVQFLKDDASMPPECNILFLFLKIACPRTPYIAGLRACGARGSRAAPPLSTNPGSAPVPSTIDLVSK